MGLSLSQQTLLLPLWPGHRLIPQLRMTWRLITALETETVGARRQGFQRGPPSRWAMMVTALTSSTSVRPSLAQAGTLQVHQARAGSAATMSRACSHSRLERPIKHRTKQASIC